MRNWSENISAACNAQVQFNYSAKSYRPFARILDEYESLADLVSYLVDTGISDVQLPANLSQLEENDLKSLAVEVTTSIAHHSEKSSCRWRFYLSARGTIAGWFTNLCESLANLGATPFGIASRWRPSRKKNTRCDSLCHVHISPIHQGASRSP